MLKINYAKKKMRITDFCKIYNTFNNYQKNSNFKLKR